MASYFGIKILFAMALMFCAVVPTMQQFQPPASLDYRTWGVVTPVKNQGSCGSDWAFSVVGAVEAANKMKSRGVPSLSEQELQDCSGATTLDLMITTVDVRDPDIIMQSVFQYIIDHGIGTEQEYPNTCPSSGRCLSGKTPRSNATISSYGRVPAGDEKALEHVLSTVGPVSVWYNAPMEHANYRGGILDAPNCGRLLPSHAALLVGYGTEGGKEFWTIKSSWGENWGEKGYLRMRKGANICGIANWAYYPIP